MQARRLASLNAIRTFTLVAQSGSLKAASGELCVTASAVSHQLKKLEGELGVRLFSRSNNALCLTEAGRRFQLEVAPAISLVERAIERLQRDEAEVCVQASTSLAVRWLIPALDRFQVACPGARVRVATTSAQDPEWAWDVSIRYFRAGKTVPEGWELLVEDVSRPFVAPTLLAKARGKRAIGATSLPALQRAAGNWDWRLWCEANGLSLADLSLAHRFDTDDAALRACTAGLGMVLAPPFLAAREVESQLLVEVPGCVPVRIGSYRYQARPGAPMVGKFCDWLRSEASGVG